METGIDQERKKLLLQSKNKGGAPKKTVKREQIMRIRLTATERFLIDHKAKAAGMHSSSWIRAAAKSAKIVPRLTTEERRTLWMLAELANNLNQLTKLAHQRGIVGIVFDCNQILKEIAITLNHLNNHDRESDDR